MFEALPNLRGALLLFSAVFTAFSLAIVIFAANNRRVQTGEFRFTEGQWCATVAAFCFGILGAFAYALPTPPVTEETQEQRRAEMVEDYYSECDGEIPRQLTGAEQRMCINLARYRADITLGLRLPPPRTVVQRVQGPTVRTVRTIDHRVGQEKRADTYRSYYNSCVEQLGAVQKPVDRELITCTRLAHAQTNQAYGGPHQDVVNVRQEVLEDLPVTIRVVEAD